MRYLTLAGLTLFATILNCAVFTQYPILGVQPDIMLIVMLSFLLAEKTMMSVLFMSAGALYMDILFAPAIGYYTLPYALTGLVVYLIVYKREFNRFLIPPFVCAFAWLLKELSTCALTMLLGYRIEFFDTLMSSTLPGLLVNGLLMLGVFLAIRQLCMLRYMRPQRAKNVL